MSGLESQVDESSSPSIKEEDLTQQLLQENQDLRKEMKELQSLLRESLTFQGFQGGSSGQAGRVESSACGDTPGVRRAEQVFGRSEDATDYRRMDPTVLRGRSAGYQDPDLPSQPAAGTAEWWETVEVFGSGPVSGDARIPSSIGVKGIRVPSSLKFDGSETKFPAWKNSFVMHAKQCGLLDAFTSLEDIPIADIGVDLTPMVGLGYTVSEVKKAQAAWWHLYECVTSDSVKAMIHNAGSASKAWRDLNDHFLPLSDAQINLYEHKLSNLKMKHGEDPHAFFSQIKEILGVLLMLGVQKEDRVVVSILLNGLTRDYNNVRENMKIHFPRNREAIEKHVRNKYLELSVEGKIAKQTTGQALVAKAKNSNRSKTRKPAQSSNPPKDSSPNVGRRPLECYRCGLPHKVSECQARVIKAPSQEAEAAEAKGHTGELAVLKVLAASVSRPFCEEWYGDTGAPYHLTDSLRCMRDLTPVNFNVSGIGGVTCDVSLRGNLTVVFVTEEDEYVAELKDVLYALTSGTTCFPPVRSLMERVGIV